MICEICNKELSIIGFNGHLATHQMSVNDYVEKYGEYRKSKIEEQTRLNDNSVICLIDGKKCMSEKHLSHHISTKYNITKSEYVKKYIFNFEKQLCECGCGGEVALLSRPPYRRKYITGHNPNGMIGRRHKMSSRRKMSKNAIKRYCNNHTSDTLPERKFEQLLKELNVTYDKQIITDFGVVDFKVEGKLVEIDGVYWHPLELYNLNIQLIQSALNDFKKNLNIPNLIRIRSDDIDKIDDIYALDKLNSVDNYPTKIHEYDQCIISKEYFKGLLNTKGNEYLFKMSFLLLDFIRTFQPNPPKVSHIKNFKEIWNSDEKVLYCIRELIGATGNIEIYDFSIYNLVTILKNHEQQKFDT